MKPEKLIWGAIMMRYEKILKNWLYQADSIFSFAFAQTKKSMIFGIICFIVPVLAAACNTSQKVRNQEIQDVKIWAVPAEQKVRPNDPVESQDLVWSQKDSTITIAGAGNEHVPFQFVISSSNVGNGSGKFFIKVSKLTSNQGTIISKNDIKLYLEHYVLVKKKSNKMGATGFWPDALAPLKKPFGMHMRPYNSITHNRPIWIDIVIPPKTPAGLYSAHILISKNGVDLKTVQLKLEVYSFSLPQRTPFIAYMGSSTNQLRSFYGGSSSSPKIQKLVKKYNTFLFDHCMEPWFFDALEPGVKIHGGDVNVNFNNAKYEYYLNKLNAQKIVLRTFPSNLAKQISAKPFTTSFNRKVKDYLSQVAEYFKVHGWGKRLIFNSPIDEPSTKRDYEKTRKWARLVYGVAPNIPFMATEQPVPQNPNWGTLQGYVDYFSVHGQWLNNQMNDVEMSKLEKKGNEITWYVSCTNSYPQPNYYIDESAMDPVMIPWIAARYHLDGTLYWATHLWSRTPNPWYDPNTSGHLGTVCSNGYVLNGGGSLLYPGNYVVKYTGQPNVNGPVSSIRFELLRQGIQDYICWWMLRKKGAKAFADQEVRSLVSNEKTFSRNRKELYKTRKAMADRLEKLSH